ncbi:MAG: phosphoenolpyruvate carboxykinase (ATP) [Candidatus Undinarchaeales archaeon]
MKIEENLKIPDSQVIRNPDDHFYKNFLRPYYIKTTDGQYLFASKQAGRRPDRAFYIIPKGYKLGKGQERFRKRAGKRIYKAAFDYLKDSEVLVQEGVQGESGFETGVRVTTSIESPHSAYMNWMGKMMLFPKKEDTEITCYNYIIPEKLPEEYEERIKKAWDGYKPGVPLTIYDFTEIKKDKRRVLNLGVDYFGGAFKKPNLTMVWNRGEEEGMISYHAGCTKNRVLKGLSGTGKTTLTVGPDLYQDDALLGKPIEKYNKTKKAKLIGLEAASFAKSQGLDPNSPEWPGLMSSRDGKTVVLAMNVDCQGVRFVEKEIDGYEVKVPEKIPGHEIGHLETKKYEKTGTTNGRFIFKFSDLNSDWKPGIEKYLKTIVLSFRRFDILEPVFRIENPEMAVALDSACESIITSAVGGKKTGKRVMSYAATDFMARQQSEQALIKLKMYKEMGLKPKDKLVFFVNNSGWIGRYNYKGKKLEQGEKIKVEDSKKLVKLLEERKIKNWIKHPVYEYLIPEPKELEEKHEMEDFKKRFNPLNYYSLKEYMKFVKRDIKERTKFLEELFKNQDGEDELKEVTKVWKNCKIPEKEKIEEFYKAHY